VNLTHIELQYNYNIRNTSCIVENTHGIYIGRQTNKTKKGEHTSRNLRKHCNSTPSDAVNSRSDNNVSSIKSLKACQILHSKAHCSNITTIIITVYKPSRNFIFLFNIQKALGELISNRRANNKI